MTQTHLYRSEAIILKQMPLGEADRILTLFTPAYGKVRAVAKGVRKPTSRMSGSVEPLTRANMLLSKGHDLDVVSQVEPIDVYMAVRGDLEKTSTAFYMAELVDAFTIEQSENRSLYRHLVNSLETLCDLKNDGHGNVREYILLRASYECSLLSMTGYRPQIHRCTECGLAPQGSVFFSASGGGVICQRCRNKQAVTRSLSIGALKMLNVLEDGGFAYLKKQPYQEDISLEVESLLRQYIWYLLERNLKSTSFMDAVRRGISMDRFEYTGK